MPLLQPLDMYQTKLRSTQFTSKVCFIKGIANYIENMTLTLFIENSKYNLIFLSL